MEVSVSQILKAHRALAAMKITGGTPYLTLRDLHRLRDTLTREVEIASQSQDELVSLHHGKISETGMISFPSKEENEAFQAAWEERMNTKIPLSVDRVDLSGIVENVSFVNADADLEALSAFITFEEEGEHGR